MGPQHARAPGTNSSPLLWSPTIRAALIAGTPWLDVYCPGCGTSRALDLRKVDRHPLASVGTLVLGSRACAPQIRPRRHPMPKAAARGPAQGRRPGPARAPGAPETLRGLKQKLFWPPFTHFVSYRPRGPRDRPG
jgi:hypothetical protein